MIAQAAPTNGSTSSEPKSNERGLLEQFFTANQSVIINWMFKALAQDAKGAAVIGNVLHMAMRSEGYEHQTFNGIEPASTGHEYEDDTSQRDLQSCNPATWLCIDFLSDQRFSHFSNELCQGDLIAAGALGCLAHSAIRRNSPIFEAREIEACARWQGHIARLFGALRRSNFIVEINDASDPNNGCYRLVDFFELPE